MTFRATCRHFKPEYQAQLDAIDRHDGKGIDWRKDDRETVVWTDRGEFEAHAKAEHEAGPWTQGGWTARLPMTARSANGLRPVGRWKRPPRRDFDPKCGEIGSWVSGPGFTLGQVWSVISTAKWSHRVIVADGERYHEAWVSTLRPAADPAEQLELIA